ncbi:MAG: uL13 family ribosomal protein [bacterium]|nr:uL13 family ribosomal protein [bacterium]MDZ4284705.1 uL13 family ribosomal protein [Patescibacteria group bacterium]
MTATDQTLYTIDARAQRLGRVAADAARVLMGKHTPHYERNRINGQRVRIEHAAALQIDERKKKHTIYSRHSGYPGSLKRVTLAAIETKRGRERAYSEALRRAVYGMLPKNKLRPRMMKRLEII